jgi:hypothetical protein
LAPATVLGMRSRVMPEAPRPVDPRGWAAAARPLTFGSGWWVETGRIGRVPARGSIESSRDHTRRSGGGAPLRERCRPWTRESRTCKPTCQRSAPAVPCRLPQRPWGPERRVLRFTSLHPLRLRARATHRRSLPARLAARWPLTPLEPQPTGLSARTIAPCYRSLSKAPA